MAQSRPAVVPVVRYVLTHKKDGLRTLVGPSQGRCTYATHEEAAERLAAILNSKVNSPETLRGLFGDVSLMAVRPCNCYPVHFDPIGIYFDD